MSWINKHKRVWRVAILVLLLVAIMGPWTFDRIHVPSEYPCSAPNIRLEGDFCGTPMSGIWIFSWIIGGFINTGVGLVTGATVFADRGGEFLREFLFIMVLLLLVLPFFSTLLLILRGDRRRRQMFHVAAWDLAAGAGLLGTSSFSRLHWALWGIWLYIGLAVSALILEVLTLAAERRPRQGRRAMRMIVSFLFALIVLLIAYWLFIGWGMPNALIIAAILIVLVIACWLFVSALAWAARRMSARVWIYAGLFILAGLVLPTSMLVEIFPDRLSLPFGTLLATTLFMMPSIALVIAALLLYSGLNLYQEWQNAGAVEGGGSQAQRKYAGRAVVVVLVLSALLLAKTLYNLYWLMVWEKTDDSFGYLWLVVPVLAALFSGVTLSIALPGRTNLAGYLYSLLISALMIAVSARAQSVDFRQLTEERAGRVSQAIESYYAREGRYPQDLRQLTPWYVLSLPGPVIIYGQDWCYAGGDDYYRLGYVYREHWSDPRLIGRIYKTKGKAPDLYRMCEEEVIASQKRYPDYPYEYWMEGE
jgi:hypothetical protein